MIGTFDYAAPEQLREGAGRRPHRRLRARRRALPGAHRQGPLPARDGRGDDARAPRLAAAVGAERCCRTRPSCSARSCGARWPRTRDDRYPSAGDLGRARSAAVEPTRRARDRAQRRRRRRRRRAIAGHAPLPLPPALAVETGRGPFVGREALLETAGGALTHRGQPASASSCCWPASPGSARRGWRPSSRGAPTTRARPSSTAARTRSRSLPYQPFITALGALRRPPRARCVLPRELALELTELARFVPGAAPPRAGAARDAQRRAGDAPLPAVRGRHADARVRRPRAPGRAAARRPALGRRVDDAAARPPAPGRARRCGCWCSAPRGRSRASCSAACAGSGRSSSIVLTGLTAEETRALVARDDVTSQLRAPADRGDRRATRSSSRRRCAACPRSRSAR